MTAPRWIAEALEASWTGIYEDATVDAERLAKELIERLPIEAMHQAVVAELGGLNGTVETGGEAFSRMASTREMASDIATAIVKVLTDDPEVVQLAEIYQGACRELDAAGVPHADAPGPEMLMLDLAGRIRWLAQQRPTRLELQRVEAERDALKTSNEAAFRDLAQAHREHD